MKQLRYLGYALLAYGTVMLVLLATPWNQWAADHSIIALVSRTDRRVGNEVHGSVDPYMSLAGDAVMIFAGLWFAFYIPRMFQKYGMSGAPSTATLQPGSPLPPPQI